MDWLDRDGFRRGWVSREGRRRSGQKVWTGQESRQMIDNGDCH